MSVRSLLGLSALAPISEKSYQHSRRFRPLVQSLKARRRWIVFVTPDLIPYAGKGWDHLNGHPARLWDRHGNHLRRESSTDHLHFADDRLAVRHRDRLLVAKQASGARHLTGIADPSVRQHYLPLAFGAGSAFLRSASGSFSSASINSRTVYS